jgi:hypothetical protein
MQTYGSGLPTAVPAAWRSDFGVIAVNEDDDDDVADNVAYDVKSRSGRR